MRYAAFGLVLLVSACASAPAGGGWTQQSWASQAIRQVTGGPFSFSAAPYGGDGFKIRLAIRMNAVGASASGAPDDAQLQAAAQAAAPEGCTVKSVTRQADGSAVADYDCG
jgi:hypothetical protein